MAIFGEQWILVKELGSREESCSFWIGTVVSGLSAASWVRAAFSPSRASFNSGATSAR